MFVVQNRPLKVILTKCFWKATQKIHVIEDFFTQNCQFGSKIMWIYFWLFFVDFPILFANLHRKKIFG
jgi:hypothetical protein